MRGLAASMLLASAQLATLNAEASAYTVQRWERLLSGAHQQPEMEKLRTVNRFVNGAITYQDDIEAWGAKDYWATPRESLTAGAGDCEDYAIAKYFSLVRLGIDQDRMRLIYVKASAPRAAHMVLAYYEPGEKTPLILDNLTEAIVSAESRRDLTPVFSMGMDGIRLNLSRSKERQVTERLPENWAKIIARASGDGSLGAPDAALEGKAAPASGKP